MIADNTENVNDFTAGDLIRYCWRGGTYGLVWRGQNRQSCWARLGEFDYSEFDQGGFEAMPFAKGFRKLPKVFWTGDVYFGVNPSAAIPPQNKRGNTDQRYIAAQTDYLACTNVLFAEYDGKDYVDGNEYRQYLPADFRKMEKGAQDEAQKIAREIAFYFSPDKYKARAMAAITKRVNELDIPPSVIVDSGGGYHVYTFLRDTVYIDDNNRDDVATTQRDWVAMWGGDQGAADIRRVLRLPGWLNCKDGWGANKPVVTIVHYDAGAVYDYAELEQMVGDWAFENNRQRPTARGTSGGSGNWNGAGMGAVRAEFNRRYKIADLMKKKGYQICSDNGKGFIRLSRPGRDGVPSISILPATDTMPEIAYNHSSGDELHADKTGRIDADGKPRKGLDAWLVYVHLYHEGKVKRAWVKAKQAFGMWTDENGQTVEGEELEVEAAQ